MLDTIINKITEAKYSGVSSPTDSPFCATISATSPLVIIPTPILTHSIPLKPQSQDISPQPIILATSPTRTKHTEKSRRELVILFKLVLSPMLAKNTGPNII